MKKNLLIAFCAIFLLGFGGSCQTTNPQKKIENAHKKADIALEAIDSQTSKIQDKGKAFVFAANYSNQQETNRTPAINTSARFLDLAQLTFGNPTVKDATTVKNIVDGLLFEKNFNESILSNRLAISESDISFYKKQSQIYKSKIDKAEDSLKSLTSDVINLQNEKVVLESKYKIKLEAVEKVNEQNADKAAKYDQENTFLNSINPFHDLAKLLKKLAILGTIGGLVIGAFRIAELFFPGLNIVGGFLGLIGKWIFKFAPKAKKMAGVVSSTVWDAFKVNVKALDSFFVSLSKGEIQGHILESIPNDAKLDKNEVSKLLDLYSDKVEIEIKNQLDKFHDEDSRGIVNLAKSDLGLSQVKQPENII